MKREEITLYIEGIMTLLENIAQEKHLTEKQERGIAGILLDLGTLRRAFE